MKKNQLSLLFSKQFFPYFTAQFLTSLNANLLRTGLVTLITYHFTTLSDDYRQILINLAIALFMLPFFLFSATAGQIADKYIKAKLIRIIQFIEIPIMALTILGFIFLSPTFLILIIFLMGVQSSFFGPIKYSILPDQVGEKNLIMANGYVEAGTFISILLGTILGGILTTSVEAGLVVIAPLLIGIAIVGFIPTLFIKSKPAGNPNQPLQFNFIKTTIEVIKKAKEDKKMFNSILAISWFWLIGSVILSQLPTYVLDTLHANQFVFSWLLILFSIGVAIGSIYCQILLKGNITNRFVPLSIFAMSVFLLDFSLASFGIKPSGTELININEFYQNFYAWRISFDLLAFCFFGGLFIIPLYASLQSESKESFRAQLIAVNNIINALFMVMGAVVSLLLISLDISIQGVLLLFSFVSFGVTLYVFKLLPDVLIKEILSFILKVIFRVEIKGIDNYYQCKGKTVIIANHVSYLDAVLLAVFLPEKPAFAINTMMAEKFWVKPFLKLVNFYPIDPTNAMSIKQLIKEVSLDSKLVIFPEGRISTTGSTMKVYPGPGLIASKTGAQILPIYIQGAKYSVFSKLKGVINRLWLPKIKIHIYPAETINLPEEIKGKNRRLMTADKLYDILARISYESTNTDKTLFEKLIHSGVLFGWNKVIMEDVNFKPLTYRQLLTKAIVLGGQFKNFTANQENVGLLLPTSLANVVSLFGLHAYNRVPAMLNFSAGKKSVNIACITASVKVVITSRTFIEKGNLFDLISGLEEQNIKIYYLEDLAQKIKFFAKLTGLINAYFPKLFYKRVNKKHKHQLKTSSLGIILFTSGSEGVPKGVMLTHKNLLANIAQVTVGVDFNMNDRMFNALPMFHSFGLNGGTFLPLFGGFYCFLYPSPLHYRIIPELIYDKEATVVLGTDTFLAKYGKSANRYDFRTVRFAVVGAEKLKKDTFKMWNEKFGVKVFEGYGATETAPVLACNTPMFTKIGSVGKLLPGIKYKLEFLPNIEQGGKLFVQGDNLMKGYLIYQDGEVITKLAEHWYDTGDIVDIDIDNYITIVGRVKRFAKIAGEMISLGFVEDNVNKVWNDFNNAIITIEDAKKGEALILVTTHQEGEISEVASFFKEQGISEINIPRKILMFDEIPLLGSGKTDYPKLQELVDAELGQA